MPGAAAQMRAMTATPDPKATRMPCAPTREASAGSPAPTRRETMAVMATPTPPTKNISDQ